MVVSSDFCSDKPAIVEDLEYAKKLREKARRKGLEMSEARSRAKSAQKKGSRGAAHIHKQEAMVRESEMKDLDKRAAKIIFRENNKVSGQLDICQRFSNGCSDPLLVLESQGRREDRPSWSVCRRGYSACKGPGSDSSIEG